MDHVEAERRLLDAAELLFYARGVQAVGMDDLRAESGVALKRLYRCFASKEELVVAYLRRRDVRWRARLAEASTRSAPTGADQVLAVFDWLGRWFTEPGFRGCAFINAAGELGATSPAVADIVREHKDRVRGQIADLARATEVEDPDGLAAQLLLLVDGAIVSAAVTGDPAAAGHARAAARSLLGASGTAPE